MASYFWYNCSIHDNSGSCIDEIGTMCEDHVIEALIDAGIDPELAPNFVSHAEDDKNGIAIQRNDGTRLATISAHYHAEDVYDDSEYWENA